MEKWLRKTEQRVWIGRGGKLCGLDVPTATNSEYCAGSSPASKPPQKVPQRPSDAICHTGLTEVKPVLIVLSDSESLEEKVCGIRQHRQMWYASCCHL